MRADGQALVVSAIHAAQHGIRVGATAFEETKQQCIAVAAPLPRANYRLFLSIPKYKLQLVSEVLTILRVWRTLAKFYYEVE